MPNELPFSLVDAFAMAPYTGNVAAVVLDADGLTDDPMQALATEFNASETAFVLRPRTRDAALRLRWFAPGGEVDFCGHATLGAVHALLDTGRFTHALDEPGTILPIETRSGVLTVRTERVEGSRQPYMLWLDMPHCEPKQTGVVMPPLLHHLGLSPDALDDRLPMIRTHDDDIILGVKTLQGLLGLRPAMSDLARYCRKQGLRGVLVTTLNVLSATTVVQSRFFAPAAGIDEDPVTGSVHGPLGLYLIDRGVISLRDGRADFHCGQAKAGGRAGLVRVVVADDGTNRAVRVGGHCVTTMRGVITRLP